MLLLSEHFPPGQAAGARRWEKLARFAAERGWGLDVLTLAPEDLETPDFSRLDSLPEGTRVFGIRAREHWFFERTGRMWESLSRWRSNEKTSDRPAASLSERPAIAGWVKRAEVRYDPFTLSGWSRAYRVAREFADGAAWANAAAGVAMQIFDAGRHRAVVSCGPPHMLHRAASRISRQAGIPLILDLRDPWSRAERVRRDFASPLWYRLAERFESSAFEQASLIAMNTSAAHQVMCRAYPAHANKLIYVTNGFDDDPLPEPAHGEVFVLAYAGSIYAGRTPRNLFRAVRVVADALGLGTGDLQIELMGYFDADAIREMSRQENVSEHVTLHPAGSAQDVALLLARAAMLVNLPQDSDLAIPSKIYEYMVYPSWLLALAEPDTATGRILAGTSAEVVHPEDVAGIAHFVRHCFEAYRDGARPQPIAADPRLGRAHQAAVFLDAIEKCVAQAAPRSRNPTASLRTDTQVPTQDD